MSLYNPLFAKILPANKNFLSLINFAILGFPPLILSTHSVENIQDEVENLLMSSNRKDVAKKYIIYRDRRTEIRNSKWDMDELQKSIWKNKYLYKDETFNEWVESSS